MSEHFHVEPQWVLVDEQLRRVSEFAPLPPRERPAAVCPLCRKPIVMKLGSIKVHHYAHRSDSNCAAKRSETALHLNTKYHLLHELQKGREIWVEQECAEWTCRNKKRHLWASDWDCVQEEFRHDRFRFDLALLRQDAIIGVLEVWATHAVGDEKEEFLNAQNYPWIEFRAATEIYDGENAWSCEQPFPAPSWHLPYPKWTCEKCQQRAREEEQRQEKQRREEERKAAYRAEREAYKRDNYLDMHAAIVVDFYFPNGKLARETFLVMKQIRKARWVKAWVAHKGQNVAFVAPIHASAGQSLRNWALHRLKRDTERHLETLQQQGTIVDVLQDWMLCNELALRALPYINRRQHRFIWNSQCRLWLLEGRFSVTELESEKRYGLVNAQFKYQNGADDDR